ncbi:radical SAM family heme chaperone HemW [Cohnella zeiphila]|uniref:Heme chaperone HemW n=1 Tax=Cohnella zeiphila TaxID=2761120 RepID=A0A7X0VU01_9BACL|nr:radical SAM family heme chaperone HemW [Cohnella zeiphila]MBB6729742.1 oxygen-independent coproporphyrinogen III oxidase [Cohnella zeiphila]
MSDTIISEPGGRTRAVPLHAWTPRALYIHIPFCTNKCFYCDFNSYVVEGQPVDAYLDALEREMERTVRELPPETIRKVFVGGGTPTVLNPQQMKRFLEAVARHFPVAGDAEFTMEANPGTTDPAKLEAMRAGGVNRISFGAQSFDDKLLAAIGRIHEARDVVNSIAHARAAGFANLSIDLMFGLPRQTLEQLADSVEKALELDLPHYSLYSLKVEENTLFHRLYERGELPLPEEDVEVAMFQHLREKLGGAGYRQYEISNFAKPGFESRHNSTYWHNEPYYGLGAGAHGYALGRRHLNVKGVQAYIDAAALGLPRKETSEVPAQEAMEDFMMVGLRLLDGIRLANFRRQFGGSEAETVFGPVFEKLCRQGLLEKFGAGDEAGYRLTELGVPLGNEVFGAFLA